MQSMHVLHASIKARYYAKHRSFVNNLFHQLIESLEHLPLALREHMARPFWDSPAIVCNIYNGARGLDIQADGTFLHLIDSAIARANDSDHKIQRAVYTELMQVAHSSDLLATIHRRACKYLASDDPFPANDIDWTSVLSSSAGLGSQVACSVLKTLIGDWLTARRLQAAKRLCPFCCQEEDSWQHFVACDVLWLYISKIFPPLPPPP